MNKDMEIVALGMRLLISYISKTFSKVDLIALFHKILERMRGGYPQDEIVWLMVTSWNKAVNEYTLHKVVSKWCDVAFLLLKHVDDKEVYQMPMEESYKEMSQ